MMTRARPACVSSVFRSMLMKTSVFPDAISLVEKVDPDTIDSVMDVGGKVAGNFGAAIVQILMLDLVFSIDSILTAVGMTDHLPVMILAVVITVGIMMVAADPLANFINNNPTVVMLALGFLLMIGAVLIADGFGVHVPKGYIYAAMAFSALVEGLNMWSRNAARKRSDDGDGQAKH